ALGVCAALVRRGNTGAGERVGASLNSGLVSLLAFLAANYFATGEVPARSGNDHAIVSPYGLFRAKDGEVAIAPSQEQSYQRLVDALGAAEWRGDPRFASNDLRLKNRAAMNAAVEAKLADATAAEWIERLNAAGVPCGRVMGLPEVFADPQLRDQQMVLTQDHPGHGPVTMLGFPVKFAEAPCELRLPAPELGADTDAVLAELGYSLDEVSALRSAGAV
ncbi:MAG TPA: CoA transferase, partial [Stellaceae bacterium]|nr:CoA transferase [Stellaceae bacterium]